MKIFLILLFLAVNTAYRGSFCEKDDDCPSLHCDLDQDLCLKEAECFVNCSCNKDDDCRSLQKCIDNKCWKLDESSICDGVDDESSCEVEDDYEDHDNVEDSDDDDNSNCLWENNVSDCEDSKKKFHSKNLQKVHPRKLQNSS